MSNYVAGFRKGIEARKAKKSKSRIARKAASKGPEYLRGFQNGWKQSRHYSETITL